MKYFNRDAFQEAPDDPQVESMADALLETAMLGSGFTVQNPSSLAQKLVKLLQMNVGLPQDAVVQVSHFDCRHPFYIPNTM